MIDISEALANATPARAERSAVDAHEFFGTVARALWLTSIGTRPLAL